MGPFKNSGTNPVTFLFWEGLTLGPMKFWPFPRENPGYAPDTGPSPPMHKVQAQHQPIIHLWARARGVAGISVMRGKPLIEHKNGKVTGFDALFFKGPTSSKEKYFWKAKNRPPGVPNFQGTQG